jgi:hypothetical protein
MKFIRRYLKGIIEECILESNRPPLVIVIGGYSEENPIEVKLEGCILVSSGKYPGLTVMPPIPKKE